MSVLCLEIGKCYSTFTLKTFYFSVKIHLFIDTFMFKDILLLSKDSFHCQPLTCILIYSLHVYIYIKYVKRIMSVFCRFLEDLEEGIYIQHSLESVLINDDGKQLLVRIDIQDRS